MKPVDQTVFDFVRGDCLRACICSILELPIEAVPNTYNDAGTQWLPALSELLAPLGWAFVDLPADPWPWMPDGVHFVMAGPSPRDPSKLHAVVGATRDGHVVIAHDPHPSREGISHATHLSLLVPRSPCSS